MYCKDCGEWWEECKCGEAEKPRGVSASDSNELLCVNKPFYFVGEYADVGHDEKAAGIERGRAYPVFSTYDKSNPDQKHTNAWFVSEGDAIDWAEYKNT